MTKNLASSHDTTEQSQALSIPTFIATPALPEVIIVPSPYRGGLRPSLARPKLQEMREGAFGYRKVPSLMGGERVPYISSLVLAEDDNGNA